MAEKSLSQLTLLMGAVRAIAANWLRLGYNTPNSSYFDVSSCIMAS